MEKEKKVLERKARLEQEIRDLEARLGDSVDQIRGDVELKVKETRDKFSPSYWIRKYPAYALGTAVFLGVLLAPGRRPARKSPKGGDEPGTNSDQKPYYETTANLITSELKRMITRKATAFLVDKIEDAIDSRFKEGGKKKQDDS